MYYAVALAGYALRACYETFPLLIDLARPVRAVFYAVPHLLRLSPRADIRH